MPSEDVIEVLGAWEGYRVGSVKRPAAEEGKPAAIWIELLRKADDPMICSGCGQACERYHDWEDRWVRDLPILDAQTHLHLPRFRVACPRTTAERASGRADEGECGASTGSPRSARFGCPWMVAYLERSFTSRFCFRALPCGYVHLAICSFQTTPSVRDPVSCTSTVDATTGTATCCVLLRL